MPGIRRREFVTLLGGAAAAWPIAARAQQVERVRRIGVLTLFSERDTEGRSRFSAFHEGLREAGWIEGRNIRIEYRWADGDPDRLRAYAAEIVGPAPEAIFCNSTPVLAALRKETQTIPIVFTGISDPVGIGFVTSLARPGGNLTGFANFEPEMGGKWLHELKEVAPRVDRVAFILNRQNASWASLFRAIEVVAPTFGVTASAVDVRNAAEIELAIEAFGGQSNGGLIVQPDGITLGYRQLIIDLAARHGLPAVYPFRVFAMEGGLMAYGINVADQFRGAASYIDRILRGAKPADLPVQAPTKFELVINLKTAKALGLEIPPTLLARVDEVIE
jgi:putative tryptophan/tyrosine transport system substrate-binding protein